MLFKHLRKLENHQLFLLFYSSPSLLKSEILFSQPRYQSAFSQTPQTHPKHPTPSLRNSIIKIFSFYKPKPRESKTSFHSTACPLISTPPPQLPPLRLMHIPRSRQPHKHRPPNPHNSKDTKTNNPRLPRTCSPRRSPPLLLQQPRPRLRIEAIIR